MARSPRVTGDHAVRALLKAGWTEARRAGSHVILHHELGPGHRVTVPVHAGRILKPKTLASVLRQAGITIEEFRALL
jgi:predicted RNA binding protein YcfA (HicA-like mRNA interferase family)